MKLKDLEHDGGEETNRKDVEKQKKLATKLQEKRVVKRKQELQEEYLRPENPALWDGDID